MSIEAWIEERKLLKLLNASKRVQPDSDPSKGLWTRCDKCDVILYIKHLKQNQRVCFGCNYPLRMNSQERIENLLDKDSWRPLDETVSPCDPLEFHDQKDYTDRLQEAQERTGLQDAIQTGRGMVDGIPIAFGVMDFDFMGGSMGSVVGEKVTRLIEYATQEGLTLVLVCASGGARMQEGVFSLMQMAKISSALQVYQNCANLLYISICTSPTTGGVTASFGMLGDIIFAEPQALIAFAGRRVIEQTLCEDLPENFQSSEYMLDHGLLDLIVPRRFLRQALSESVRLYKNAPFKKPGRIPFGVQNPISFLVEEKIRRRAALVNPLETYQNNSQLTESNRTELSRKKSTLSPNPQLLKESPVKREEQTEGTETTLKSSPLEAAELDSSVHSMSRRERLNYRAISTSFQTMFSLFARELVVPYPLSGEVKYTDAQENVRRAAKAYAPPVQEGAALSDMLLQRFMTLSEKGSSDLLSGKSKSELDISTPKYVSNGTNTSQADQVNGEGRDLSKNSDSDTQRDATMNVLAPFEKNQAFLRPKEGFDTRQSGKKSAIAQDFLNQSIELAATECVEWRAFYVYQKMCERTDFLEDFVQSFQQNGQSAHPTQLENMLFYRLLCREIHSE